MDIVRSGRFDNRIGAHLYWTKERTAAGLKLAAAVLVGSLPCCDSDYNTVKKGRFDWPPAVHVLKYFGSMARGWLAAGAEKSRVSLRNNDWTKDEELYLLDNAGEKTLQKIANDLGRSYPAVRARLNKNLKVKARHNQGFLSAGELAKLYQCPYHRVRCALASGDIAGRFDRKRNSWQVDLAKLDEKALGILRAPKTHSYRNSASDLGDYYKRYGLYRKLINGKLVVVDERMSA